MEGHSIASIREFLELVSHHGSATAIKVIGEQGVRTLSYEMLLVRVKNLARLISKNIAPGDRVALYKLDADNWAVSYFAVLSIGAIAINMDHRFGPENIREFVDTTKPKYIFSDHIELLESYKNEALIADISILNLDVVDVIDQTPKFTLPIIDPKQPAQIIFSSGTWGTQNGIVLSHENIVVNLVQNIEAFRLSKRDVFLSIIPVSHMFEVMIGFLLPLYYGATISYTTLENKDNYLKAFSKIKPTKMVLVPFILEVLYDSYKSTLGVAFPPLHRLIVLSRYLPRFVRRIMWLLLRIPLGGNIDEIIVGGAPLTHDIDYFLQGLGTQTVFCYGFPETAGVLSVSTNQNRKPGESGYSYPVFELSKNPKGELLVRGSSLFLGYWPNVTKDQAAWFNTGDIAFVDDENRIVIKGNSKNLFVYATSEKIFAEEIENITNKFLKGQSCCINMGFGLNNDLKLIVTDPNVDATKFQKYLESKLPAFVDINDVIYYGSDTLPTTHSGEIDRRMIQEWLEMVYFSQVTNNLQ